MNKKSGYIETFLYISTEYRALLYCIKKYIFRDFQKRISELKTKPASYQ